jgi:mono/diheme cytochrome c family protein
MTRWLAAAVILLLVLALPGCMGRRAPSGFRLPPGDAEAGRAAFVALECHSCHTVAGVPDLPAPRLTPPIALGGKVPLPRTDGDLTTDIILPSSHFARGYPAEHVQEGARSKMPDYTERMSVRQLADLVAFLQAHYEVGVQITATPH